MLPKAVDRYIIAAVLPYVALGLTILTTILLIQQTTRFADILGSSGAPLRLTMDVALNLLPSLLIFTLPMSTLVGVATGFSRMGQDSELIAMRAAGIGTSRIILPTLILGASISLLTSYIGFTVAPYAAQNLREIGLRAAFYKLESPIEPKSFYTGMPGKVVYVREGDRESGQWEKIFIYWREPDGQVRIVTAQKGRLDFSGDQTELVLEDVSMTILPAGGVEANAEGKHVTIERSASMRLKDERLNAGRLALAKRMREREPEFDEMDWEQLAQKTRNEPDPARRREAQIALHKRLALSFSPIIFALLGACLGLKATRGGRSQGVILSLASMLLYYLVSMAGEQLGRAGVVSPILGSWLAFCFAIICALSLLWTRYWNFSNTYAQRLRARSTEERWRREPSGNRWSPSPLGLLDRKMFKSLTWNFLITFISLVSIFIIFTLFELLRFIALNHISGLIVLRYFIFLLPFTSIAVTPISTLLSVLITFALMVRRSESIAWWASGQSIFRLILPCTFFAALLGMGVWFVQEKMLPAANRQQNILRGIIKTGAAQTEAQQGRMWVSSTDSRRIYTFDSTIEGGQVENLTIFKLNPELMQLEQILTTAQASLGPSATMVTEEVEEINLVGQKVTHTRSPAIILPVEEFQVLNTGIKKPSEFDSKSLSAYIKMLKARGVGVNPLLIALERRKVELIYPLVMVLIGAPLALVLGRRSSMLALCIAIGIGLAYLGITNGLQQVGASGLLSPSIAAWSPSFLFLALGIYLLSRSQT